MEPIIIIHDRHRATLAHDKNHYDRLHPDNAWRNDDSPPAILVRAANAARNAAGLFVNVEVPDDVENDRLQELRGEREALTATLRGWENENLEKLRELEKDSPYREEARRELAKLRADYTNLADNLKDWDDGNGEELAALEKLNG